MLSAVLKMTHMKIAKYLVCMVDHQDPLFIYKNLFGNLHNP